MNTREKFLVLAIVLLVATNMYDSHQVGHLRETVHQQKIALLKECVQDFGVRNCSY